MSLRSRMFAASCAFAVFGLQHMNAQSYELFGGYTVANMKPEKDYSRATMSGWNTSVTGYPLSYLGITGDVAGYYGQTAPPSTVTINGTPVSTAGMQDIAIHQYSFMAGPQLRILHRRVVDTSFRAVFGAARGHLPGYNTLDQTTFAALLGTNIDWNVSRKVALRFSPGLYVTQYGPTETQKNFRFSIGPVFRLGGGD